ncbi:Co2+/Mg2+ efflux protein ApaG [Myxococcota bacterium]|nr:Co2+/Mg2+ efflux protein ApaG [Myxococcota bacterium]
MRDPTLASDTVTRGVRVQVQPEFLPDQSSPEDKLWVHAYHVTITNEGADTVQLVSRHWVITNADGKEEHVRGPGVVGFQPVLAPGESFQYSSGCPLDTAVGSMHGSFQMIDRGGARFDAAVGPFTLAEPFALN